VLIGAPAVVLGIGYLVVTQAFRDRMDCGDGDPALAALRADPMATGEILGGTRIDVREEPRRVDYKGAAHDATLTRHFRVSDPDSFYAAARERAAGAGWDVAAAAPIGAERGFHGTRVEGGRALTLYVASADWEDATYDAFVRLSSGGTVDGCA
jgi:hypothetical protein